MLWITWLLDKYDEDSYDQDECNLVMIDEEWGLSFADDKEDDDDNDDEDDHEQKFYWSWTRVEMTMMKIAMMAKVMMTMMTMMMTMMMSRGEWVLLSLG